jgi:hypothetical protein
MSDSSERRNNGPVSKCFRIVPDLNLAIIWNIGHLLEIFHKTRHHVYEMKYCDIRKSGFWSVDPVIVIDVQSNPVITTSVYATPRL